MSNKLKVGLAVIAVLLVAGLFYVFGHKNVRLGAVSPSDVSATNFTEVTASNGMYIGAGGMTIAGGGLSVVGSSTNAGITTEPNRVAATLASTTRCAIQSPTSTSTLVYGWYTPTVSTSTSVIYTFARATTAFSTTTNASVLATSTVAANTLGTQVAATTTPVVDSTAGRLTITDRIFAPSTFLNVTETGGQGPFNEAAICGALFQTLN